MPSNAPLCGLSPYQSQPGKSHALLKPGLANLCSAQRSKSLISILVQLSENPQVIPPSSHMDICSIQLRSRFVGRVTHKVCRWTEDFRFRVQDAGESSSQIHFKVRDGSGKGLGLGGATFGRAVLNTSAIIHELDKMRSQQLSSGVNSWLYNIM